MVRVIYVAILLLSGCFQVTYELQCRTLQNEGKVFGTLQSCVQCASQFGTRNVEMLNGCALGLDASQLMQPPGQQSR